MKQFFLVTITLLFVANLFAQKKTNPTTTAEVEARMKDAQQQLDKLTPEQKKMMEQMGMKPNVPSMPAGASDDDVKAAVSGGIGVPSKNATLIAAIPKTIITEENLPAYLADVNKYISGHLSNEGKAAGETFYTGLQVAGYDVIAIANNATGLWINGDLEPATYIMGKVAATDSKNTDNLSNLAAMLSMAGAPHMAIPILDFLVKKYPDNTTILNNLGQAWFYLGETDKANAQLDKVVKAFAYHPQANQTQCLILQSKGKTTQAIEKMKNSMQHSVTLAKINTLRKMGYKLKGSDMRKPFKPDPNPLGLKNIIRPEAPTDYNSELKLKADWDAFEKQINNRQMELSKSQQAFINNNNQKALETFNKIQGKSANEIYASSSSLTKNAEGRSVYAVMADINLNEMNKDGGIAYRLKTIKAKIDALQKDYIAKKDARLKEIQNQNSVIATRESEDGKAGQNLGYDGCVVERKFSEWVYSNYNKQLDEAYQEYQHQMYLKITEELYWKQFKYPEAEFEAIKINAKKEWLAALVSRYIPTVDHPENCKLKINKESKYKLADFEDLNCKYHSSLNFGGGNSIETHCSKMTVNFSGGPLSGNINYRSDHTGKDRLVNGTVEATVIEKSVGAGPVQAGAKAGMGIEFTNSGIEDVYVNAEASAMTVTASGKMSLISGNMSGGISGFGK